MRASIAAQSHVLQYGRSDNRGAEAEVAAQIFAMVKESTRLPRDLQKLLTAAAASPEPQPLGVGATVLLGADALDATLSDEEERVRRVCHSEEGSSRPAITA